MILEISIWEQDIENYLKVIETNNNIEKVFLNCFSDEDYLRMGGSHTFVDDCVKICRDKKIPIILGTFLSEKFNKPLKSFDLPKNQFKKIQWPTFFIHRTFNLMNNKLNYEHNKNYNLDLYSNKVNLDSTFDYLYITLNNIAKPHRSMFMDMLEKHNLISKGAIAWRNVNRSYNNATDALNNETYPYKYWKPKVLLLDQHDFYNLNNQEILPKQYNQSFMQVVAETDDQIFFLTEKTSVPLLFQKPFLVLSCPKFHSILNELGFKLYDEIFDYSFDTEESVSDRVEGIIKNLIKIDSMSYDEKILAFKSIENKLIYNRELALSYVFDKIPVEVKELSSDSISLKYIENFSEFKKNVY